jgi:hypothetical protein
MTALQGWAAIILEIARGSSLMIVNGMSFSGN